jgi:hypothetical protein
MDEAVSAESTAYTALFEHSSASHVYINMRNFIHIISQIITDLVIELLKKIYSSKSEQNSNDVRKLKKSKPIKLSKQKRYELQMKYDRVLIQFLILFVVGIAGHFFFHLS